MLPINKRRVSERIALTILTFGLYYFYWQYKLIKNTRAIQGKTKTAFWEMVLYFCVPVYSVIWWNTRSTLVYNELKKNSIEAKNRAGLQTLLNGLVLIYILCVVLLSILFTSMFTGIGWFGYIIIYSIPIVLGAVNQALMQNDFNKMKSSDNSISRSIGEIIFEVVNIYLLAGIGLICLYPMIHVLFASFSEPSKLMAHSGLLYKPVGFFTRGYEEVFAKNEIWTAYGNTFIYVVAGTLISLVITATFAYVLSRKGLYWNKYLSIFALITMYFGGGLIPVYLSVKDLGLLDTRWAILLPTALSTYNMIIMRSGFAAVPEALEEAAEIDGAGPFRTFTKIVLPLALPTVAVIALYYAVTQWNAWFNAAIYLTSQDILPLQLYLRKILVENKIDEFTAGGAITDANASMMAESIKYATIIVSVIPILCVYPFIQKYFTKGVMVGAVKG